MDIWSDYLERLSYISLETYWNFRKFNWEFLRVFLRTFTARTKWSNSTWRCRRIWIEQGLLMGERFTAVRRNSASTSKYECCPIQFFYVIYTLASRIYGSLFLVDDVFKVHLTITWKLVLIGIIKFILIHITSVELSWLRNYSLRFYYWVLSAWVQPQSSVGSADVMRPRHYSGSWFLVIVWGVSGEI